MQPPYFIWNEECSLDKNIIVNELPPISRATKEYEEIDVPGRSGKLYIDKNSYESIPYQIECTLLPGIDTRRLASWLEGTGKLIISLEPGKFYEGIIKNQIDFKRSSHVLFEFSLEFELQPFSYSIEEKIQEFDKASKIFISDSTALIKPYIKIIGNGPVTLTINNKSQIIKKIEDYIELDSDCEEAFKDTENLMSEVEGEFLELEPGENNISWIGDVRLLILKYRETYI